MVKRFIGSGRMQEGGFLVPHKMTFNAHTTGGDLRHGAIDIDMEPIIPTCAGATVQATLECMAAFLAAQGSGFVSIGKADGYDGYAAGVYNVGAPTTPTLTDTFLAAFADTRLQNGGVVLLMAGTYQCLSTIEVPPGITIMGELAGSIIINHAIEEPIFKILQGRENTRIGGDSGPGELRLEAGEPLDATTLWNLVLADNLDGYRTLAGNPISTMETVPMVECEVSSNFSCKEVRFIGKINNGPVAGRGMTLRAIGYTTGGGIATHLAVERCFFDGMRTAIDFSPGGGNIDHLTVNLCKARTFGTESAGTLAENCFVSMSLCNATLTHNYHVGYGVFPTQVVVGMFIVSSLGGGSADVNVIVSGNSGGPSSGVTIAQSPYFAGTGAAGLSSWRAIVSGNNWGTSAQNPWFITVGDGSANNDGTTGDFMGAGAIDLILSSGLQYATTVIVNAGTYAVTENSGGEFNFIGNTKGVRPIFTLNLGTGVTDHLSQRTFVCGGVLKNISFQKHASATFASVRPGENPNISGIVAVDNCEFVNCTLSVDDAATTNVQVTNCQFSQDNTVADSVCMLLPRSDYVLVDACQFTGNGYIGLIGTDAGITYATSGTFVNATYVVRNCIMDLTGFTIDDSSPLAIESYFVIDDVAGSVHIENCHILTDNTLAEDTTAINGSLAATFQSWIRINAEHIYIDKCLLNGPAQTYQPAATTFPLPILNITPALSARIMNSTFKRGGMCLKVGGTAGTCSGEHAEGIFIDGCTFDYSNGSANSMCLIDVELEPTVYPIHPVVSITNNKMFKETVAGTASRLAEHSLVVTTDYDASGAVQIYAKDFIVNFRGNSIHGNISSFATAPTASQAALVINTFNGSSVDTATLTPVTVSDNDIFVTSAYASASASDITAAAWLKGTAIKVDNNSIHMLNSATLNTSQINCLYLTTLINTGAFLPPATLVTNNVFSRRGLDGDDTSGGGANQLVGGFVRIDGLTTGRGTVHSNVFSDDTTDGTDEVIISDQSGLAWISYNNINEIQTMTIRGGTGQVGMSIVGGGTSVALMAGGDSTGSLFGGVESAIFLTPGSSANLSFNHNDQSNVLDFRWIVSFRDILPIGAEIISVAVATDVTANASTGQSILNVVSLNGTDTNSSASPLTTAGHSHVLATAAQGGSGATLMSNGPHINQASSVGYIEVFGDNFNFGANDEAYTIAEMVVKYRW